VESADFPVAPLGVRKANGGSGRRQHFTGASRPMKNLQENLTTVSDAQASATCIVCQKPIVDSQWFCRVPQKNDAPDFQNKRLLLCSPSCAYRYFAFKEIGASQF
jgi:hypothetical protein